VRKFVQLAATVPVNYRGVCVFLLISRRLHELLPRTTDGQVRKSTVKELSLNGPHLPPQQHLSSFRYQHETVRT
jgi:hypothetical protein